VRFLLAFVALSACFPVIIPLPVTVPASEIRVLSSAQATDQTFETFLNAHRAKVGLSALSQSPELTRAATAHAADMEARGYFDHKTPEGLNASDRAQAVGVPSCGLGENIAFGQKTSTEVLEGWLASGPHRRNLENAKMASYGLGHVVDMWVLMLYAPC